MTPDDEDDDQLPLDFPPKLCAHCGGLTTEGHTLPGGQPIHWDCMSVRDQRLEAGECEGCGAEPWNEETGEDDQAGWIIRPDRILCPACMTAEAERDDKIAFVQGVRRGQELARREGREYPAWLAERAEEMIMYLEMIEEELDHFEGWPTRPDDAPR